jgi:hypothetical protein
MSRNRPARLLGAVALLLGAGCGVSEIGETATPGATAGPVQIEGRLIPPDKIVVFVHIGHSNMAGRATGPEVSKPFFYTPDPQLWSLHWVDRIKGTGLPLILSPAYEPTAPDDRTAGHAGPGMAILRAAQAMAPPALTILSVGHGLSGSFGGQCDGFRRGGVAYPVAMEPAKTLRGKVVWGGIFAMFGTSEVDRVDDHLGFLDCLAGVAADMREDLGDAEIPFLVGEWEAGATGIYAADSPTGLVVAPQLKRLPEVVPRSAVIPSAELPMEDDHHYNLDGHRAWAERGMAILKQNGWAPWATP